MSAVIQLSKIHLITQMGIKPPPSTSYTHGRRQGGGQEGQLPPLEFEIFQFSPLKRTKYSCFDHLSLQNLGFAPLLKTNKKFQPVCPPWKFFCRRPWEGEERKISKFSRSRGQLLPLAPSCRRQFFKKVARYGRWILKLFLPGNTNLIPFLSENLLQKIFVYFLLSTSQKLHR